VRMRSQRGEGCCSAARVAVRRGLQCGEGCSAARSRRTSLDVRRRSFPIICGGIDVGRCGLRSPPTRLASVSAACEGLTLGWSSAGRRSSWTRVDLPPPPRAPPAAAPEGQDTCSCSWRSASRAHSSSRTARARASRAAAVVAALPCGSDSGSCSCRASCGPSGSPLPSLHPLSLGSAPAVESHSFQNDTASSATSAERAPPPPARQAARARAWLWIIRHARSFRRSRFLTGLDGTSSLCSP